MPRVPAPSVRPGGSPSVDDTTGRSRETRRRAHQQLALRLVAVDVAATDTGTWLRARKSRLRSTRATTARRRCRIPSNGGRLCARHASSRSSMHRVELLLRRIPRLEQVVVEVDDVDGVDRGVGVGVGGQQHPARLGEELARLAEKLRTRHFRHPLVDQKDRDRAPARRARHSPPRGLLRPSAP